MSAGERLREVLRVRCVHLKTKSAYVGRPDDDEPENDIDTAVWWCEHTCDALGADGGPAEPARCDGPGRACYRGPVRL